MRTIEVHAIDRLPAPSSARRGRRAQHRRRDLDGPALRGLRRGDRGQRPGCARRRRVVPPPPDGARHHAARHGGLRGGAPAWAASAPSCRSSSSPRATHRGQGPRPDHGRRRLRDQALQPRGAGGPHPRDPAPHRARGARVEPARVRRPRARRRHPRGHARRPADRPDRHRVPAAALPDAEPAPRAHPRAAARPRVGLRLRRRRPRARDLHQLPAQEGRRDGRRR